ncbi:MAG: hypothetical protein IPL53_14365 [Ignavibacteria bacterium]|nr:hypothetical protein [Ignavibacteria bacterium]
MKTGKKKKEELPGYPDYPDTEDIFSRGVKLDKLDPDDVVSKNLRTLNPIN